METHQRDKIILIAICAAIVLGIFLWPLSALGIAWPYGGVPDAVRIRHTPFDVFPSIDVTLPADESAALIEHLQGYRARFVWFGRQYVFHTESYSITLSQPKTYEWAEISLDGHGTISQQNPQPWRGKSTFRLYGSAVEELLQICNDWAGPDSKYPGVAFLKEFFAIGKDGRSDKVQLDIRSSWAGRSIGWSIFANRRATVGIALTLKSRLLPSRGITPTVWGWLEVRLRTTGSEGTTMPAKTDWWTASLSTCPGRSRSKGGRGLSCIKNIYGSL